jgi:membrane fusion protein (multidrug efflux system)
MSAVAESAAPAASASPDLHAARKQKSGVGRVVIIGVIGVLAIGGYLTNRMLNAGNQSTDDAMVDADVVPISVRVGGQVLHVHVSENTLVKKGDVIAELDPAELTARVHQAEGDLAAAVAQAAVADAQQKVTDAGARGGLSSATAQVKTARAQLGSAAAQIEAAQAQKLHAEVQAQKAAADYTRAQGLRAAGATSQEAVDNAKATLDGANAALASANAQLSVAMESKEVAASRVDEAGGALDANTPLQAKIAASRGAADVARARVTSAQATLDLARTMLSYATVTAPADGMVSRLTLREGQLVSTGQAVASLVPTATYVVANFKETQMTKMKPGQTVDVEVDALPGQSLHATVESIAGATGSRFSLLPPDNAAGNFVKVVQRVPVRIHWNDVATSSNLRAGMSAVVTVHTN